MDEQYGSEVRARRRALDLTQMQLARAIGRSPAWIGRLEHLQLPASEIDKRKIEAYFREHERFPLPRARAERVAP